MKKTILTLFLLAGLIGLNSCKKEDVTPKITFNLISKDPNSYKRLELYVGQNFEFNEPFYGSKEIVIDATEKEYDVYFVYLFYGKSTDTLHIKGLNTDTTIALVSMKSYSFKIR